MAFIGRKGHLVNMFPLTFIEVGNILSHPIMEPSDDIDTATTSAPTLTALTTQASLTTIAQQQLQQQLQHVATTMDVIWKNSLTLENITQINLIGGSSSFSNSGSGAMGSGVNAMDGFDTDSTFMYTPPMQRPETIFITILFLLIFVVGVLGNGTLVIIFFRHRSMRNIPNT